MKDNGEAYSQARVHDAEFRLLEEKLGDLKERVSRVESSVSRGMALLVANLAGVIVMLAQEVLGI